jgi:hypothetical protein
MQALAPVHSTPSNPPFPEGFGDFWTAQAALVFLPDAVDAEAIDCMLIIKSPLSKKQTIALLRMRE